MHIKGERAKRELAELENREKYAMRKLMEATIQKKKENEGNIFLKCYTYLNEIIFNHDELKFTF